VISINPPAQKITPCVSCVSASGPSVLTQKNLEKCRRHVEEFPVAQFSPECPLDFFERTAMEKNPTYPTCRIMPCWARYCTAPGEPAQQLPLLLLEPQWSLSAEDFTPDAPIR